MRRIFVVGVALTALAFSGAASATEVEIKMLNKGADGMMVFEPSFVKVAPGDSIKFVPTDKGHNVESIQGMLPDGAIPISGKMSEQVTVTLDKPGVYGFRCKPHYGMGMAGLIVVGTPGNEDAAKAVHHPGKAKDRFAALFAKLDSLTTAAK